MKKLVLSSILLSSLLLSGATLSQAAGSAETDLNITVKPDTGTKPEKGPHMDNLSIVFSPTAYRFSGIATDTELRLQNENPNSDKQFIAVYDDRPTDAGKWKLEGQLSKISKLDENGNAIAPNPTQDQTTDIQGNLVINTSKVLAYDIGSVTQTTNGVTDYVPAAIDPAAADATNVTFGESGAATLTLPAGDASPTRILTSTANAKNGAAANLGDAKFIINAGSAINSTTEDFKYTGKITWTVASQP